MLILFMSLLVVSSIFNSPLAIGNDFDNFVAKGGVVVDAQLVPSKNNISVVNQQILLAIDVKTQSYFVGGTAFGDLSIPGVLATQRNKLASNYTERIDGNMWTVQRWEFTLYPSSKGLFEIPKIPISVVVMNDKGEKVSGVLWTKSLTFPVSYLKNSDQYVATSQFNLEQDWTTISDDITSQTTVIRSVTMSVHDTLSILLPTIDFSGVNDKYDLFCEPERRQNSHVRGEYLTVSKQTCSYTIPEDGNVQLPDITVNWWSTESNTMQKSTLPGKALIFPESIQSFVVSNIKTLSIILLLIVLSIALPLVLIPTFLSMQFVIAILRKDRNMLLNLIYKKQLSINGKLTLIHERCYSEIATFDSGIKGMINRALISVENTDASQLDYIITWCYVCHKGKFKAYRLQRWMAIPELFRYFKVKQK